MKKKITTGLILALISTILSLFAAELYVRYSGRGDIDGNFFYRLNRLRPYKLPIKQVHAAVDIYLKSDTSYILYDPDLGWTHRPNSASFDGLYKANSHGIRSAPSETALTPRTGRLRIVLLGDSFTHADDVVFEDSWGHLLEMKLKEQGIDAEVLNFGVAAYGIDQAYLRWKKDAARFSPDIVIFGFVADNMLRNLNMFWSIRSPGMGFFFSKPRFVLRGDALEMVNSPAVPPENLVNLLRNFDNSELAKYEYFYYKPDYIRRPWHKSKLFTHYFDTIGETIYRDPNIPDHETRKNKRNIFDPGMKPGKLAIKIIDELRKDVEAHNSRFIVAHLFSYAILTRLKKGKDILYSDMLKKLDENFDVIHPENAMLKNRDMDSIKKLYTREFVYRGNVALPGHMSREGNQIVADLLAEHIIKLIEKQE